MPGGPGQRALEQARVERQYGSGDRCHAGGHGGEQRAARHGGKIGADQQRRIDHADEDVGRRRGAERPADVKATFVSPQANPATTRCRMPQ